MSADHAATDGDADQPSADGTGIPLPEQKPTEIADVDPVVHTRGNTQRVAHIAAQASGHPVPLCIEQQQCDKRGTNWVRKEIAIYPDPDDWFSDVCTYCQTAYEQIVDNGGQA